MLTPAFELTQDEAFVIVLIKTPYVKISDVDFYVSGSEFKFYVKPYFLRLQLPGDVVEDGRESASFDVQKGLFTIKLPKLNAGEEFPDLDMLTTLLAPRRQKDRVKQPLIEVLGNEESGESSGIKENSSDEEEDFDWEVEQVPQCFEDHQLLLDVESGKYGFANQKSGIFTNREEELHEIADVPDAERMTHSDRRSARLATEDQKFDEEYYLADFFEDENVQQLISYSPEWKEEYERFINCTKEHSDSPPKSGEQVEQPVTVLFTEDEKEKLRRLPNKEYLMEDEIELSVFLGLVDIMFAFAYNRRTTEGDNTVESAWTISKISATLSWFETFVNLHDVIVTCCRRCLCYPLVRHWGLIMTVLEDTKQLFLLGRRQLLKCLLEVHSLFSEDDPRYILNELYITDYCVWLQKTSEKKLMSLAQKLNKIQVCKNETGFMLEELEDAAAIVRDETGEEDETSNSDDDDDDNDKGDDDDSGDDACGDEGDSNDDEDNDDDDDDDDKGDDDDSGDDACGDEGDSNDDEDDDDDDDDDDDNNKIVSEDNPTLTEHQSENVKRTVSTEENDPKIEDELEVVSEAFTLEEKFRSLHVASKEEDEKSIIEEQQTAMIASTEKRVCDEK